MYRSKKMELLSFTKNVAGVMQEVEESAKREVEVSLRPPSEADTQAPPPPGPGPNDRAKIVVTIQDKKEQNKFRVYAVSFFFFLPLLMTYYPTFHFNKKLLWMFTK